MGIFRGGEEDQRDAGGAGHHRDGERDDEGLGVVRLTEHRAAGKNHAEGDEEQQDAAGDAEGGRADTQEAEQVFAGEEEAEQDHQRDEELADQHGAAARLGDLGKDGVEDRRVAEGIEHQEEGDGEGQEIHSSWGSGSPRWGMEGPAVAAWRSLRRVLRSIAIIPPRAGWVERR